MDILAVAGIVACFIYDPTMNLLLNAGLPENYQTWLSFSVCLLEEIHFLSIIVGLAIPTLQLQIIAFQDVDKALQALIIGSSSAEA